MVAFGLVSSTGVFQPQEDCRQRKGLSKRGGYRGAGCVCVTWFWGGLRWPWGGWEWSVWDWEKPCVPGPRSTGKPGATGALLRAGAGSGPWGALSLCGSLLPPEIDLRSVCHLALKI